LNSGFNTDKRHANADLRHINALVTLGEDNRKLAKRLTRLGCFDEARGREAQAQRRYEMEKAAADMKQSTSAAVMAMANSEDIGRRLISIGLLQQI